MTKVLASAMVIAMALALFCGVLFYGAVDPDVAGPMYLLGLLAAILWACKLLFSSAATWKHSPMHWPVLAFGVYAVVRYFTSPIEHDARVELLYVALSILAYFTACQFYRPTDRTILIGMLLLLVAFESGYALWQFSTKTDAVLGWFRPDGFRTRGSGSYVCPNNFAGFLVLSLGLILARGTMMSRHKGSVESFAVQRLVILYVAVMAVVGIAVSLSRGGWAATLAGLAMLVLWSDWRSRIQWGRIAAVAVALVVLGTVVWKLAPARVLNTFTKSDQRGNSALGLKEWTLNSRVRLWTATLPLVRESPVFGTGIGTWQWLSPKHKDRFVPTHPEYAHNEYLNLLSDYGAVGVVLMLWVFVGFYRQAKRVSDGRVPSDERSFAVGATVGVTAVLVHSLFDFNQHIPANAFMLAIVMGSTAAIEDPDRRFPRGPMPQWARWALGTGLIAVCALLAWQFTKAAMAVRHTRRGNDAKYLYILNPDIALDHFRRAIAAEPRYPMPHWKTADILRQHAQWRLGEGKKAEREQFAGQARQAYATALRLNPYQTEVLLRAAAADELAGDDNAALQKYLRAVELEPNNSINQEKIGQFYRDRDQPELALKHYERAQKLQPYSVPSIDSNVEEMRQAIRDKNKQ